MSVAQVASNSDQIELWQELTALISHMNPILDKIQEYSREAVPTDLLNEVKKQQFAMADLIYLMRTVFDGHMLKDAVLRETEIPYRRMTSVLTTASISFMRVLPGGPVLVPMPERSHPSSPAPAEQNSIDSIEAEKLCEVPKGLHSADEPRGPVDMGWDVMNHEVSLDTMSLQDLVAAEEGLGFIIQIASTSAAEALKEIRKRI